MTRPRQMYAHCIDMVQGNKMMGNLTYSAKLSANVTIDPVFQGRVVHLNSDNEWEMGCTGWQMAGWLNASSDDPDVEQTSDDDDRQIIPVGVMTAIMATGAWELSTTEFDSAQTYVANEPLRAVASNSNATTGGRMTNQGVTSKASAAPQNATAVCGIVSGGVKLNSHRQNALHFWPVFCEGASGL